RSSGKYYTSDRNPRGRYSWAGGRVPGELCPAIAILKNCGRRGNKKTTVFLGFFVGDRRNRVRCLLTRSSVFCGAALQTTLFGVSSALLAAYSHAGDVVVHGRPYGTRNATPRRCSIKSRGEADDFGVPPGIQQ